MKAIALRSWNKGTTLFAHLRTLSMETRLSGGFNGTAPENWFRRERVWLMLSIALLEIWAASCELWERE